MWAWLPFSFTKRRTRNRIKPIIIYYHVHIVLCTFINSFESGTSQSIHMCRGTPDILHRWFLSFSSSLPCSTGNISGTSFLEFPSLRGASCLETWKGKVKLLVAPSCCMARHLGGNGLSQSSPGPAGNPPVLFCGQGTCKQHGC